MRVVRHGVANYIGNLCETTVVMLVHSMKDASLNRFQPVINVGYRTVEYDIGGVVDPIVFEHSVEREGASLQLFGWHVALFFHLCFGVMRMGGVSICWRV